MIERLRRLRLAFAWVAVSLGLQACGAPPSTVHTFYRAEMRIENIDRDGYFRYPDNIPRDQVLAADQRWEPIELYHHMPRLEQPAQGPVFRRAWYRFELEPTPGAIGRYGVLVPRFMPGAGHIVFYLDGQPIDVAFTDVENAWNHPMMFTLPRSVDHLKRVWLHVAVTYDARSGYLLAAPLAGAMQDLRPIAAWREFVQIEAPRAMSYALLVLGLFALGFWLYRRREVTYLLFALGTVAWFVRTLHFHVEEPVTGRMFSWWLTLNSMNWLMLLVYLFAMRFQQQRERWAEWLLGGLVIVSALVTLPWLPVEPLLVTITTYTAQLGVALAVTTALTRNALRLRTPETRLLAVAIWINVAFGAYDLLLQAYMLPPERVFLLPYGALFLFGAFLFAVTRRFSAAIGEVEQANFTLEARLRERTIELEASYDALRKIEKERVVGEERQRLMREMHDGLGSSLMSSLVMVEQGRLEPAAVAVVLRECIDDLKLTIDSLEPIDHDLVTLLATLRYRLGRRLEMAGLQLDWRVDDLPPLPWLDAVYSLQVLRILQEALTNIVKHAGARVIRIETAADAAEVRVIVRDDGHGFAPASGAADALTGRGLVNMARRAEQLRGRVDVSSDASGTTVTLHLPRDRRLLPRDATAQ
ncbi:MAG: hypothetical protein ING87_14505 [Rhodocyclaceae bacterium]|nr:hypothetical protein [Rhodocyclaceae bacterium]MCA3140276.1 hypothetical protein [Rhodocyclaceae bacterium]